MLQANGIERDFLGDDSVNIFDMYNRSIYPQDGYAKSKFDLGHNASELIDRLLYYGNNNETVSWHVYR